MSKLAKLKYSVARTGSFKITFVCVFLFLIPTIPLNKNIIPFCSSLSSFVCNRCPVPAILCLLPYVVYQRSQSSILTILTGLLSLIFFPLAVSNEENAIGVFLTVPYCLIW